MQIIVKRKNGEQVQYNVKDTIGEAIDTIIMSNAVYERVLEYPKVTPQEPRKGHWLGDSAGYKCDKCGHDLLEIAHSIDYIDFKKPNFCPNCGADMREVEE